MPKRILRDMQDKKLFTEKIKADIYILAGTMDNVVPNDWVLHFAKAQEATIQLLHDDHMFSKNMEKLPKIINNVLDRKH